MPLSVHVAQAALDDLASITDWIADQAGADVARAYAGLILDRCESLADFPLRGRLRRAAGNVRSIPFRRSATILYRVTRRQIVILRVLHAGRDTERELATLR